MRRIAVVLALLLALAVAFVAGMRVGRSGPERGDGRLPQAASTRAVYSPQVLGDPWFLDRQRENVEALERECADSGELCTEARAARRWLDQRAAKP